MSRAPNYLDDEARKFWNRWLPVLKEDGTLTDRDLPTFELMARNWSLLKSLDPKEDSKAAILFMSLQKQFLAQCKAFGVVPDARRKVAKPEPEAEVDEFGV